MRYCLFLFFFLILLSCNETSKTEAEIASIPMEVKLLRFDKEFAAATPQSLQALKQKYPVFFPEQFHDSVWLGRINDTLQQQLDREVLKEFPDETELEDVLLPLFKHIKYYFPEFTAPTTVTVTSDVDYQNKAIIADTLLVLSLDTYLGADHEFYQGIQKYIAKNLEKDQIVQDVAKAYAEQLIAKPSNRSLVSYMVYYGKELYLKDLWIPAASDAEKIGYSDAELKWANDNEEEMWRYFVENELVYSTDPKLLPRFIYPAPFSKFYLEIDNESPGRVGRYLGWQIVRSYMKNTEVSVKELLTVPANEIFTKSKYKPVKK